MDTISQLPSPYREIAEKYSKDTTITNFGVKDSLEGSFSWEETKERDIFWLDVSNGNYPEITEEIKSYHPDIFPPKPEQKLPEEFAIVVEVVGSSNVNAKEVLAFLKKEGYNTSSMSGSADETDVYYTKEKGSKTIDCTYLTTAEEEGIPVFTLEEAKQIVSGKTMKEETKKIVGYLSPTDMFNNNIDKGEQYVKRGAEYVYVPAKNEGGDMSQSLPKEIVETWEAVYEEEKFLKGDIIVIENYGYCNPDASIKLGQPYKLVEDFKPKLYLEKASSNGIHNNGWTTADLSRTKIRKATPEEIKTYEERNNKVELTLGSQNDKVTVYRDGRIITDRVEISSAKIHALITTLTSSLSSVGHHSVTILPDVRSILVGCSGEGHIFSINELRSISEAHKNLNR